VKYLYLLLSLVANSSLAQVLIQFKESTVKVYQYNDGDEFNSPELDKNKWSTSYPWGRYLYCSNDKNYYSDQENFVLKNGKLQIIAKNENVTRKAIPYESDDFVLKCDDKILGKNIFPFQYTSGMLHSNKKYFYGYYEISFKAEIGSGLWPAFWLFGGEGNEEIDIFEIAAKDPNYFHVDVHCPNGCDNYPTFMGLLKKGWGANLKTTSNWNNAYNIIGLEWTSNSLTWFLNGQPAAYWKGTFSNPMNIIANLAVTSNNKFAGDPNPKQFPKKLEIDYIRYWKEDIAKQFSLQNAIADFSTINTIANSEIITKKRPVNKRKLLKKENDFVTIYINSDHSIAFQRIGANKSILDFTITSIDASSKFYFRGTNAESYFTTQPLNAGKYKLEVKLNGSTQLLQFEVQ
jgi:beta-glucanase (GH16 family)